jgi:starch phosphorylase
MLRARQLIGAINGYAYRATVSAARPASDYTARIIAQRDGISVPLQAAYILWQR